MVILDRIDGIAVSADSTHANGIGALQRLAAGLNHIYRQVRGLELALEEHLRNENGTDTRIWSYGNDPQLSAVPTEIVECFCHWYSVTAVNFVFAVNSLDSRPNRPKRRKYREILGTVADFRNKVGAHLAKVMEDERDNDAERLLSLTPLVAWDGRRFSTVPFTFRKSSGADVSTSDSLAPWVLTKTHEDLSGRFPMLTADLHNPAPEPMSTPDA